MFSLYNAFFAVMLLMVPQLGLAENTNFDIKRVDSTTIFYTGKIVSGQSFLALKDALTDSTTTLIVRSQGGSLLEGVRIGSLIVDRKLSVEVDGYCLSSCANNLFLAGHTKRLRAGAVLGFHGSMNLSQKQIETFSAMSEAELQASLEKTEPNFDDLALHEWQLLRKLQLEPSIHVSLMEKLEAALPPNQVDWIVAIGRKKYAVRDGLDVEDRIVKLLRRKLTSLSQLRSMDINIKRDNPYGDAMFFPMQSTLERFGVKEILEYSYPSDELELKTRAKVLVEKYDFSPLRVAGEFPRLAPKQEGVKK